MQQCCDKDGAAVHLSKISTMKKLYFSILGLTAVLYAYGQDTTTLQHLPPEDATEMHNYWGQVSQGTSLWGYYLGHNAWGDEAFGEKYEVPGEQQVVGVIAHLGGTSESSNNASYKVYTVGSNGLPASTSATKNFVMGEAPTDGITPHMVMFNNPVAVNNEFFVVLDLGDYSHSSLQGDTLCLMSGAQGSRPASDDTFGRNVIRWHGHGGEDWKDFLTQNFTPLSIYFAIYPVLDGVVSTGDIFVDRAAPQIYPVPAVDVLNVAMNLVEPEVMQVMILSIDGRLISTEQFTLAGGENRLQLPVAELASGAYVIAFESPNYRSAARFVKQ